MSFAGQIIVPFAQTRPPFRGSEIGSRIEIVGSIPDEPNGRPRVGKPAVGRNAP